VNSFFGSPTSFRFRVLLPPLLVLLFLIGLISVGGNLWVRDVTRRLAQAHADTQAAVLANSQQLHEALADPSKSLRPLLNQTVDAEKGLLFAIVRLGDQTTVGTRSGREGEQLAELLLADQQRFAHANLDAQQSLPGFEFIVARRQIPPTITGGEPGELQVACSLAQQGGEYRSAMVLVLVLLGTAFVAYALAGVYMLSVSSRQMDQLNDAAHRIEAGDLKVRLGVLMPEELAAVGRAFDAAAERLAQAVGHITSASRTVERTASDVGEAKSSLQRGINTQVRDVDDALQSVREIMNALAAVVKQAETTRDDTRIASNVTVRLSNNVQESTATVEEAERVVTLASDSIQQVSSSTADIAKHADTLSDTTASTASAMLQMKHSIARVRETAITAASLAEQAGVDAERGTQVLTESVGGIERIREASHAIGSVTEALERRVGEIGDVLHLITELTQRTNLLALNASIIAAQAGAEGRGFAVVADEIKDLARRTANSAGSIDTLIQAVAEGAHAARRAAIAGADAVETGATQSNEAARTMTDILSRLRNSAAMSKSIAAATDEQARSSSYVTRSIQEVQGHVNEIAIKATEQTRRAEYLQRQVGRMRELVETLSKSSREQREGMVQVSDTLIRVVRGMEEIGNSQRGHLAEGERVRGMLEVLRRVVTSHRDQIFAFDRAVGDLNAQATVLRTELTRMV
jgi:methyl-accepting chemotaxis protein